MSSRLYSAASSWISSVSKVGSSSSASIHSALPGPETPDPILTRRSALSTAAGSPFCRRPSWTIEATTPYEA